MTQRKTARLMFVSTQMETGGAQVKAYNLAEVLRSEGVPVELVFLYRKHDVPEFSRDVQWLHDGPAGPLDLVRIMHRLYELMKAYKPTAVVGFAHYASPIACGIAKLAGVRKRVAVQANPPSTFPSGARLVDKIAGSLGVYTCNITASQTVLDGFDLYPASYRSKLKLAYNGIKPVRSDKTQDEARRMLGLPMDAPLLVTVGRLSAQKNQKVLLEALVGVPGVHLAILGEGELRNDLEQRITALGLADRVRLLGAKPPSVVPIFLKAGDIFVFPSTFEAFGLAVVEAMSAGLPVIASTHASMKEVVGDAGLLVPAEDVEGWRIAIGRLLANPPHRGRLAQAAITQSERFSMQAMKEGYSRCIL